VILCALAGIQPWGNTNLLSQSWNKSLKILRQTEKNFDYIYRNIQWMDQLSKYTQDATNIIDKFMVYRYSQSRRYYVNSNNFYQILNKLPNTILKLRSIHSNLTYCHIVTPQKPIFPIQRKTSDNFIIRFINE